MFLEALSHLISPRVCRICGCSLTSREEIMCLKCSIDLPRTGVHRNQFNTIHQRLGHHCAVHRAAGWFTYRRGAPYSQLLIDAKYRNLPRIDKELGRMCATELSADDFFDGIDMIVPMPMYWWKRLRRGYNQAEEICRGISQATDIPTEDILRARRSHGVQSRHNRAQRFSSIADTMQLVDEAKVSGRHVLIVDDIITSGASLQEAVRAVSQGHPACISVLALGLTALD